MASLVTDSNSHLAKPFQVEARIANVCQNKGCFFIAQQGQHILRVSFRDYGFLYQQTAVVKPSSLLANWYKKTLAQNKQPISKPT
jgi:hypothetical protein